MFAPHRKIGGFEKCWQIMKKFADSEKSGGNGKLAETRVGTVKENKVKYKINEMNRIKQIKWILTTQTEDHY
jgi:hypothetical protein